MKRLFLIVAALVVLPIAGNAQSSKVPPLVNYQGYVTDAAGNPIGPGTAVNREVIFRFWNSPTDVGDPNRLYSESQTVTILDGDFSVLIGQGTPVTGESSVYTSVADVFASPEVFLGITVDDGAGDPTDDPEISPRQQIVTTAFAFRSKVAESVDNLAITTPMLAGGAVMTNQLGSGAVTSAKLASNAVSSVSIIDGSIAASDLANNAVTNSKIQADAVTGAKIADGTITASDIGSGAVGSSEIADGSVTTSDLSSSIGVFTKSGSNLYYSSGSVGVGTNGPNSRFHINGNGVEPSLRVQVSGESKLIVNANGGTSIGANETSPPANGLYVSGNVGIGTANPTKAKLEINGWGGTADQDYAGGGILASTVVSATSGVAANNIELSLYASKWIVGEGFYAFSDERIKHVDGRSDSACDLATLLGIEVTNYTYIDTLAKGAGTYKKVIAQQVEQVFPQAVTRFTDVVPDIYRKAKVEKGWVKLATDIKKGERVRLIGKTTEGIHEVLEVAEGRFRTDFAADGEFVFVYGREVDDFRSVDYEAIAMLNVSATQQIKKEKDAEVAALWEENSKLRARLEDQAKRLAGLEAKDKARDAKLAVIEKLLRSAGERGIRLVSSKTPGGAE